MIRVGFIGDVVGRPGREELKAHLSECKVKFNIDFVVANCENASGGFGLSAKNAMEIFTYGVDIITGGNHSFDKSDIFPLMDSLNIIRPYNHYEAPGKGVVNIQKDGKSLSVINMLGIMGKNLTKNPFLCIDEALKECLSKNILIDFHAEMTSEKNAFLWQNKGRVSAIIGTHTHIGTDDLHIVQGTAFLSDAGLVGARQGVIGMDGDASLAVFKSGLKHAYSVNLDYKRIFQMVIMDFEDGECKDAFKIRIIDKKEYIQKAYFD